MEIARGGDAVTGRRDGSRGRCGSSNAPPLRNNNVSHRGYIYNGDHFIGAAITPAKPRDAHYRVSAETPCRTVR